MTEIDMSEEAVLRRLRTVDRLRNLCLTLKKAKLNQTPKVPQQNDRKKHK
jgi:hypothetical protein